MKTLQGCVNRILAKRHQLSTVLMVLIGGWLIGAIVLVGLSLNMSWRLEDRGTAINEAGSLRKRVFYISLLVQYQRDNQALQKEHDDFKRILSKLSHLNNNGFANQTRYPSLDKNIANIEKNFAVFWQESLNYHGQTKQEPLDDYLKHAEVLTEEINKLVSLIELENTNSIKMLRWFQVLLILMAVVSALASSRLLKHFVIRPLQQLDDGIAKLSKGKFDTQIVLPINNEIARVGVGFNQMAVQLDTMYDDLEEMVFNKTVALRKRNHDLAFLYEMASLMQESSEQNALCDAFLHKLMAFCGAKAGSVRLYNKNNQQLELISGVSIPDELIRSKKCSHIDACFCGQAHNDEPQYVAFNLKIENSIDPVLCQKHQLNHFFMFHIRVGEEKIGIVNVYFQEADALSEENAQLLESVTGQLGIAIGSIRLNQLDKHMAVLEERNLMAQGLHDSIAQSLSFLNMQVQVLEQALQNKNETMTSQVLQFIEEGIQGCYDDVRELLTNFRVRLARGSFKDAIKAVIERFERQTHLPVEFRLHEEGNEPNPEEQLQSVFILQEALSNIRKHAKASYVTVQIRQGHDAFDLQVDDNGQGFLVDSLLDKESQGHVGARIMKERASKVNGLLTIDSKVGHGTHVHLLINRKNDY